jgi:hypothetical protein
MRGKRSQDRETREKGSERGVEGEDRTQIGKLRRENHGETEKTRDRSGEGADSGNRGGERGKRVYN